MAVLSDIIRMLATRLGDFKEIISTDTSGGTSFVDTIRLSGIPSDGLDGSELIFVSPVISGNYLRTVRVTGFSEGSQTLTLEPPLPFAVSINDVAWLVNLHSSGYYFNQYIEAVNGAIRRSYPNHLEHVVYTSIDSLLAPLPWDADVPWISLPATLKKIYGVDAYMVNEEQDAFSIPMSAQNKSFLPGWWWDYANQRLVINEPYNRTVEGFLIRVRGYGMPATLTTLTDTTTVDIEWIVDMGYEELKHATGDQRDLAAASMGRNIADSNRGKMVTITIPGTLDLGR